MIRKEHRIESAEIARRNDVVLADAAFRVADAVHALIPGCTAVVAIVGVGSEWRMLAQRGPQDLSGAWRRLVAETTRIGDPGCEHPGALVVPVPSERISARLVMVPLAGVSLPESAHRIVRPLLDAGGVLLDSALSAGTRAGSDSAAPRSALRPGGVSGHDVGCRPLMGVAKGLWASVQGDPVFMRRVNGWLTVFWVAMIPLSLATGWVKSVVYVSALSLWALVSGHWSAWQAARVEVNQAHEMQARAEEDLAGAVVDRVIAETDVRPSPATATLAETATESPGVSERDLSRNPPATEPST